MSPTAMTVRCHNLIASLAVALGVLGMTACGGAGHRRASGVSSSAVGIPTSAVASGNESNAGQIPGEPRKDKDHDGDNPTPSYFDRDDYDILAYGHAAGPSDAKAIVAVVRLYYVAAAHDDGAAGCAAIYSLISESIPEDYGQSPGPPSLRGKTCAAVMTKMFEQDRRQYAPSPIRSKVLATRVGGVRGYAIFGIHTTPERYILLHREFGAWKLLNLSDSGLP